MSLFLSEFIKIINKKIIKILILISIIFFGFLFNSFAKSDDRLFNILSQSDQINLEISGKNYIKYLKQINLVGQKESITNNSLINTHKKRWISAKINLQGIKIPIKIKLHGNNSDHISTPYSSLNLKKISNKFEKVNLLRPNTRNYDAEIFGTILLKSLGIITPETKFVKVKINDEMPENYLLQEKIDNQLLRSNELFSGPIIKFSDKDEKLYLRKKVETSKSFLDVYEIANSDNIKNYNSILNTYKAIGSMNYYDNFNNYYNYKFQLLLSILNACHGLSGNDPIYYFNNLINQFYHIYYDGMFFENYPANFFCNNSRFIKEIKFKKKFISEIEAKINDKNFKKKIEKTYLEKIYKTNNNFNNFWDNFEKKFYLYKNLSEKLHMNTNESKISLNEKLNNLNFFYPTIYSYSKNKKIYLCIKWPSLKKSSLINQKKQILKKSNTKNCKEINYIIAKKIINNNYTFFEPNYKIEIHPIIIGNLDEQDIIR